MSWYRNPLFWLGTIGAVAVGGFLINRRQRNALGLAPRGGSMLPPGLLSRKQKTPPKARDFDEPPPHSESVPPPEEAPPEEDIEDFPSEVPDDFDVETSPSNVAVRKLCRTAKLVKADPNKLCTTFCKETGWKTGACVADECICTDKKLGKK